MIVFGNLSNLSWKQTRDNNELPWVPALSKWEWDCWVWEDYPSALIISKAEHGSSMQAKPASYSPNHQTFTEAKLTSCLASGWTFWVLQGSWLSLRLQGRRACCCWDYTPWHRVWRWRWLIEKDHPSSCPTKVHLVKVMVFPVVMYRCESWTIKKAELDAFKLWCWRRLLRVPWTARRSNQSILKEIKPEYSVEGLVLKLKLLYFGCLMRRADSMEKGPDAGKVWGQEEKRVTEDEMVGWHHWLNEQEFEQTLGDGEGQGKPGVLQSMGLQRVGNDWVIEQ